MQATFCTRREEIKIIPANLLNGRSRKRCLFQRRSTLLSLAEEHGHYSQLTFFLQFEEDSIIHLEVLSVLK